jgi:virulence-associated protein VapD
MVQRRSVDEKIPLNTQGEDEEVVKQHRLSAWAKETDSKRIVAVQVYQPKYSSTLTGTGGLVGSSNSGSKKKPRQSPIRWYHVVFLAGYLYQLVWVATTIGEPYREFLAKAEREGFAVMQGSTRYRAELEHAMREVNNAQRRTKKIGWFDWMDMDIEALAEEKRKDLQKSVLDSLPKSMRVPGRYQTAFWPTLVLGIWAVLHALVILMQHWSVAFNVAINYREVDAAAALELVSEQFFELDLTAEEDQAPEHEGGGGGGGSGKLQTNERGERIVFPEREITVLPSFLPTHARIIPAKGHHILIPLQYYPVLGMTFEYHRRRYCYDVEAQVWSKIRCRTTVPLTFLSNWTGFPATHQLVAGQIRFGPNLFKVKQPTFGELYQKQLLNPFSVFQIFCVLLWAIDDYIIYSIFSLFMVLVFEGTVVYQRIKSLQNLTNMGNPSRNVYVHRSGQWTTIDSAELLPGDVMSLTRVAPRRRPAPTTTGAGGKKPTASEALAAIEDKDGDIVPADLLLLRGSTVVNEASLTGESVPQMKEGLTELEENEQLSMKIKHKMNVVYAGTKMLQCKGDSVEASDDDTLIRDATTVSERATVPFGDISSPPDHGCVCFVLRTGFASAQGKLVRMIEGSQEKVKGHERETGLLLLLLCIFAIISSGYVLYHGIQNEDRSKYELLLHCIMIVTNVIRPELPMQMAMAVNNSLVTLLKMHIFCTEPYRVPVAGKLNACLFDKTGTVWRGAHRSCHPSCLD